jgi:hypothetical protein
MSNLVILLSALILIGIINKHGSIPFSFKISKVVTHGYSTLIIPSRIQIYPTSFFNGGITLVVLMESQNLTLCLKQLHLLQTKF